MYRKINLGIVIDELNPKDGGKYTYQINLLKKIKQIQNVHLNISFFIFNSQINKFNNQDPVPLTQIKYGFFKKLIDFVLFRIFQIFNVNYFSFIDNFFIKKKIDLIYFITPNHIALYVHNIHTINTVWDLLHLDGLEFPETGGAIPYKLRDEMLRQILPKSIAIMCDSIQTIDKLSQVYSVDRKRCFKLEYSVPEYLFSHNDKDILKIKNFNLKQDYIFYPSQLWSHKNHIYVLEALKIYNSNNKEIFFLFSGADKGNLAHINKIAKELDVEKNILYLDFVRQDELISLYKNAIALVMPTYDLPTNIPPLEALYLECPIIYSKSQKNNELFYKDSLWEVDLNNPGELSKTIFMIKNNQNNMRDEKIKIGKSLLKNINNNLENNILNEILKNYISKIKTYKK